MRIAYSEKIDMFFYDEQNIYTELVIGKNYPSAYFGSGEMRVVSPSFIALKYKEAKDKLRRRNMQIKELKEVGEKFKSFIEYKGLYSEWLDYFLPVKGQIFNR